MLDNLEELQTVIKQMQQKSPRRRMPDWLRVVAGLSRLATIAGVLILLGVAGSAIRPHADKIKELVRPRPAPAAPAASVPAIIPSPSLPTKASNQPKLLAVSSAPASLSAKLPTHKVGDIFAVASWEYCVNAAIRHKSLKVVDRTVWPEPGREFLTLGLTICNMGEETAIVPPLRLIGPNDACYEPSLKAGADASIANESFGTDRHYRRQVVFEVPTGKSYQLVLQGGWMSESKAVVEIGR